MKKLFSIIIAFVLSFALSLGVFAQEPVDDELIADIVEGVGDLVDAESEGDDEALQQAIEHLYADLQEAQQTGDMSEIIDLVVEYALSEDADTSAVFTDLAAVEAVINQVLSSGGYDIEAIKKELQANSALNTLVGLYNGAEEPPTQADNSDVQEYENQPEVVNPSTGDSYTGVAVALSVLVACSAAAVTLSKKED